LFVRSLSSSTSTRLAAHRVTDLCGRVDLSSGDHSEADQASKRMGRGASRPRHPEEGCTSSPIVFLLLLFSLPPPLSLSSPPLSFTLSTATALLNLTFFPFPLHLPLRFFLDVTSGAQPRKLFVQPNMFLDGEGKVVLKEYELSVKGVIESCVERRGF
jgi:hypothetical protein